MKFSTQIDVTKVVVEKTDVDYTSEFVISIDDAMLAINNPDEDIESVDLYCDGFFVANIK